MNIFTNFFKKITVCEKTIFIVEDNEIYAKSLQIFIQSRFPKIKEIIIFKIGETCLMELHRNPSIVIMDYFLNSKYEEADNGLEIIKRIKTQKPQTNIIVLSAQEKFDVVIEAIKQYDCNYVQKDQEAFNKVEQLIKNFNQKKLGI
ncbi:MAG: hypothetical protein A2X08_10285 [Bacteroidetes bacterium GWA2_32_17]|nr:MAG: hypothetical protein A2X08_10285 [Bacteroidetes bacterium GWA2_32_17]